MPQRSAQWRRMAAREQNGNAPALSAMAANGCERAKWECPSNQRNGGEWLRASKMGMPQHSARWQRMAAHEQNGDVLALSAMAANGCTRAKWECPSAQRDGSEWLRASKMGMSQRSARWQRMAAREQNGSDEGIGMPRREGRRGRDPRSREECQ